MSRNNPWKLLVDVRSSAKLLLLISFTLSISKSYAQFDGGIPDNYNGTAIGIAAGNLSQNDSRDFSSVVSFSTTASALTTCPAGNAAELTGLRKIQNIVRLVLNEETSKYLTDDFTTSLPLVIRYSHDGSTWYSNSISLTVSYSRAAGATYDPKSSFVFEGAEYVEVDIDGDYSPMAAGSVNMSEIIYVENEMRVTRYYQLQSDVTPSSFFTVQDGPDPKDNLPVFWSWPADAGNNATQLEWTWLDTDLRDNYTVDGEVDLDLLFRDNATRIDLPFNANSYNIPLFYDGPGSLYYRIRPVNFAADGTRTDGQWATSQDEEIFFEFVGHEENLNWQVRSGFAEEGKMKSVMQYFDGSLRPRQTVTKENVHNTTVTAETFYDFEGRPAIQVLPAPSMSNVIAYTRNLNLFNGQVADQNPATLFDLEPLDAPDPTVPPMSNETGASNYYSTANPDEDANPNTPDAEGYPYSTTRYTPDGTGRIRAQSGVGKAFKAGSDQETKYYYGSPSQEELDGLFGTEVGDKSHYFKNMVKDANGQMSVSYVDMHGRTIATALAGGSPVNLQELPHNDQDQYSNQQDGQYLTRSLLDPTSNFIKGNTVESITSLLVPAGDDYDFSYSMTAENLESQTCSETPVCYECKYDLEIVITDESGENPPRIKTFNNLSIDGSVDSDCETQTDFVAADDNSPEPDGSSISFTEHLPPGSYSIRKTLKISEASFQQYKELYLQPGNGICQTQDQILQTVYSELQSTSDCNNPTEVPKCQKCLDALSDLTTFRSNYLISIGYPDPENDPENTPVPDAIEQEITRAFNDGILKCNNICNDGTNSSSLLPSKRLMMLADMMPSGGQYALAQPPTPLDGSAGTDMFDKYNIFSESFDGDTRTAYFRQPRLDDGEDIPENNPTGFYRDRMGNIDQELQPGDDKSYLENEIEPADFITMFQNSWADALLVYHPEYPRLIYVEQHLANSTVNIYDWINHFNSVETYQEAQTLGYIITDAAGSADPFWGIATGKTTKMNEALTGSYDPYGHSLWQIARIQVLCKNIFDENDRLDCWNNNAYSNSADDPFYGISDEDQKNALWQAYRKLYSGKRDELVNEYISEEKPLPDADELVREGYKLWFGTNKQTGDQSGFNGTFPDGPTDHAPDFPGSNPGDATQVLESRCDSYIDYWKNKLLQCDALKNHPQKDAILNDITARMVQVCKRGIDEVNPYGSSTVSPAYEGQEVDQSFEDIIYSVYGDYGINTHDGYFCNPFVIDNPKPYDKGPLYPSPETQLITECACDNFSLMKAEAHDAEYNENDFNSFNAWLASKNLDLLTEEVFNALSNCSTYHQTLCTPSTINKTVSCYDPNPCVQVCDINTRTAPGTGPSNTSEWNQLISCFFDAGEDESSQPANLDPSCQANFVNFYNTYYSLTGTDMLDWTQLQTDYTTLFGQPLNVCNSCTTTVQCEVEPVCHEEFLPYVLSSPQRLPVYLKCGGWPYDNDEKCLSCDRLSDLSAEFKGLFNDPVNSAPILDVPDLDADQLQQNILFAAFLNYRTGLQLTWAQYAKAALETNCTGLSGSTTTTSDLVVNHRVSNTPATYVASHSIEFVPSFMSGTNDVFETNLTDEVADGSTMIVCHSSAPVNDATGIWEEQGPCEWMHTLALAIAQKRYQKMLDDKEAEFEAAYREKCLSAKDHEEFTVGYSNKEYHYTLYYYDAAGTLIRTVPPKGVRPVFEGPEFDAIEQARLNGDDHPILHEMTTEYRYNSLNAVNIQYSPDANLSHFWYDKLGRLVVSQNAKQSAEETQKYSYTIYDELGRITEVGQKPQTNSMSQEISQDETALADWLAGGDEKEQMTITGYDFPYGQNEDDPNGIYWDRGLNQENLRNRVSYTLTRDHESDVEDFPYFYAGTFYTYDVHGNVGTLLQDYSGVEDMQLTGNRQKRIEYNYDLVSGKVNMVSYQPDYSSPASDGVQINDDKFFHRYNYDAENRLVSVETSRDKIDWERDAAYSYYKHGPLARVELGQKQVQGIDYAYTLQGWLKGINGTGVADGVFDMGYDGLVTEGPVPPVARDVIGLALHYYDNWDNETRDNNAPSELTDYKNISQNSFFTRPYNTSFVSLYNGNIAGMSFNNAALQNNPDENSYSVPLFYNYSYDQLNRIKNMTAFSGFNTEDNGWLNPETNDDYSESVSYDPNGNITDYDRNGSVHVAPERAMDNLHYDYIPGTNKLLHVSDLPGNDGNYPDDIDNQEASENYVYDQIGNLVHDQSQGNEHNITWTVYGKIATITKSDQTISFTYDAAGNRITKTADGKTTVYVRDASGNVMSIYERPEEDAFRQVEIPIYGSTRIGLARRGTSYPTTEYLDGGFNQATISTFTRGAKIFELTNHLGNVMATIIDRKLQNTFDESTVGYYTADVVGAQDYYPFGSLMPGRKFSSGLYRYGFNGKENDNEVKGIEGSQHDYGMRVYDPRLARFLSVDPLTKSYPFYTPYSFAGNKPIWAIDLDGAEEWFYYNNLFGWSKSKLFSGPYTEKESNEIGYFSATQVHQFEEATSRIRDQRQHEDNIRAYNEAAYEWARANNPFTLAYDMSSVKSLIDAGGFVAEGQYTAAAVIGIAGAVDVAPLFKSVGKAYGSVARNIASQFTTEGLWGIKNNFVRGTLLEVKASASYIAKGFEWLAESASPFFRTIDFYKQEGNIAVSLKTVNADKNFDFNNILENIQQLANLKAKGSSVYNGVERKIVSVELHIATPKNYDRSVLSKVEQAAAKADVPITYVELP